MPELAAWSGANCDPQRHTLSMRTDGFRLTVPMTSLGVLATEDSILLIWPTRQFGGRFARPRAIANRCGRIGNTCLLGADKLRLPTRLHALNNLDLWKWKNHFPSLRKELLLACHNTIFKMPG